MELLNALWSLVQPFLTAVFIVFAVVAIVRTFAMRAFGHKAVKATVWKLFFMGLALLTGIAAGLVGWAPPVSEGLAGRIGSGFLVAGLAIVNRDVGARLLTFSKQFRTSPESKLQG